MSNYKGYTKKDNVRRKQNNISGEDLEWGNNRHSKAYTTSGSKLADYLLKKKVKESRKAPVKKYSKEELAEYTRKKKEEEDAKQKTS